MFYLLRILTIFALIAAAGQVFGQDTISGPGISPVLVASVDRNEVESAKPIFADRTSPASPTRTDDGAISKNIDRRGLNTKTRHFGPTDQPTTEHTPEDDPPIGTRETFHWTPALIQSGIMLGFQHGVRMFQAKTRKELGGPFFRDWGLSVKNLRGWRDGDSFITNYIGHPLQGATTGRIFVNNSDNARKQEFGLSRGYVNSRLKALAWSAAWSTQFELGPVSEADLGNVGMYDNHGPSRMAWVDMVMTPVMGTGVLVGEDAIDKYILKNWLEKNSNGRLSPHLKLLRSLFTPTMSVANLLRGKVPWKRDNR